MYFPIGQLPNHSRVWVFQSNQIIVPDQEGQIKVLLKDFCDSWTSHNQNLKATYEIKDGLFVVVAINEDEASASGCGIDKLMHLMQQIGGTFGIDFFNRLLIAVQIVNGATSLVTVKGLQEKINNNEIGPNDYVFDNLVTTLGQYRDHHRKPIYQTWLSKYFGQDVLAEI